MCPSDLTFPFFFSILAVAWSGGVRPSEDEAEIGHSTYELSRPGLLPCLRLNIGIRLTCAFLCLFEGEMQWC